MELLLMRHTDAEAASDGGDFKRTLSEKGRKQAEKMGDWLRSIDAMPDVIAASPLFRAVETADIVAKRLAIHMTARPDERLASGMTPDDAAGVIHEMGKLGGSLMLVGHEPDLSILVAHMLGAGSHAVEMRKGAVACLDVARAGRGGSVLRWLITPNLV